MPPRARRADARDNHALLLAAAKDVFAADGPDAPLDRVARRAGVGNATMYRHFPSRRELLIAVYADEVAALRTRGESLLAAPDPADALFAWLADFVTHVSGKADLARSLTDDPAGERNALFATWHSTIDTTATALLTRAQAAGTITPDVDALDLLLLATGIAPAPTRAPRLLALIRQTVSTPQSRVSTLQSRELHPRSHE